MTGDAIPRHMRPWVYVTRENLGILYRDSKLSYDMALLLRDPCSHILQDSLANERADQSEAAKKDRARRAAERAELLALEHRARHTQAVPA